MRIVLLELRATRCTGKLCVLGSCHLLCDQYIDKEDNDKLREIIFTFLTTDNIQLNSLDADDPEVR